MRVCEWHRTLFEWQLSPWGPCSPASSTSTPSSSATGERECVTAQRGVQRRHVTCARRTDGEAAADARVCEAFAPQPPEEQACLLPCPINCVLSAFSPWSACRSPGQGCGASSSTPLLQHRTRQVLAAPLYGGAECPSLSETRQCQRSASAPPTCPHDQQEHSYSLWAGPWGECRIRSTSAGGRTRLDFSVKDPSGRAKIKRSGEIMRRHTESIVRLNHHHHHEAGGDSWDVHIGYQTRQVRCTRSDGKNVMLR